MSEIVKYQDMVNGLNGLKLGENPVILVHSSLKSFGQVEGGAQTVVDALLHLCGSCGTLVVPTLSFRSVDEAAPFFDVCNTPSECGIITETVRKMPSSYRSVHVVSSAAAVGARAEYITECHGTTPCGNGSPYQKVIDLDGYVLFLGAKFGSNTLFHAAEEAVNPAYLRYKTIPNIQVKNRDGSISLHSFQRYDCTQTGIIRYLAKMEEVFESRKVLKRTKIGNSEVILIKAVDDFEISCEVLKKNPEFILGGRFSTN